MAEQRFSRIDRWAFWEAYDRRCAYCGELVRFLTLEIDHIIPENLASKPDDLAALKSAYGLPDDFDLRSELNLVAACGPCNGKKLAKLYPPGEIMIIREMARKKAETIAKLREKCGKESESDLLMARLGTAIESGAVSRGEIREFFLSDNPQANLANPLEMPPSSEVAPVRGVDGSQTTDILRIFGNASHALLGWSQEIGGQWMHRPEFDELQAALDQDRSSLTVLLGDPGSGKSALLARLAMDLREKNVALLALKADLLPKETGTLDQLDDHLGVPAPLAECIRQLAVTRPVVLLIDQIDALTELMDQHSSRLTVLLSFINRIRGMEDVHILLSCRDFEFRHDLRLSALKPASVRLADPPWDAVKQVLAGAGIDAADWPDYARELLRRPQHLSLFVQHLAGNGEAPAFQTYHSMLEAVLHNRIISQAWGASAMDALEVLAGVMLTDEELWLPVVRFQSKYQTDLDHLVAAGVLTYSPDLHRIGFRHQTLFDFVRARAFAARVIGFANHVFTHQDALFVRPTVWSALRYLRNADPEGYRREFQTLWDRSDLRRHIRYLLIAFLGQVADPNPTESGWLLPLLGDVTLRAKAVRAIEGNPAWFARLTGYLPALMSGDPDAAWHASWILRRALSFDRDAALTLMERYWLPDPQRDGLTLQTLWELKEWDERAIRLAETVVRRAPHQGVFFRRITDSASKSRPELAPRIVAAELWGALQHAEEKSVTVPKPPPDDESDLDNAIYRLVHGDPGCAAVKNTVSDSSRWYNLCKVATAGPSAFVEHVWPWVIQIASKYASAENKRVRAYRWDSVFDLPGDHKHMRHEFTIALDAGIIAFAAGSPDKFLAFFNEQKASDLLTVHRLLAHGLRSLPEAHALDLSQYVLADVRRLALGPYSDVHRESRELIIAGVPYLNEQARLDLERYILSWQYTVHDPDLEPIDRRARLQWNREHRLRLLRAIPSEYLSSETTRLLEEEERALPDTKNVDREVTAFTCVASPVSPDQMQKASDENLLNLFTELHDGTGSKHPRHLLKGGVIQTSRAFGEFAKANRQRALQLMAQLQSGRHEFYAAEALRALAEVDQRDASHLIRAIHQLDTRGFHSEDFHHGAAWCLAKLAPEIGGLDAETCSLLEGWLQDHSGIGEIRELEPKEAPARSILLSQRSRVLPHGNYPVLHALFLGYLSRKPVDADEWLGVLERHLHRHEDPEVWMTLANYELVHLARAERGRAAAFIQRLVERNPDVLNSEGVVHLIARAHVWVPPSLTQFCLAQWETGTWGAGPQAAAEIGMLRHALAPEDDYCRELVGRVLRNDNTDGEKLRAMRVGLAFLAAEVWGLPQARPTATRVLLDLLPDADVPVAQAWLSVFHTSDRLLVDKHTQQIFDGLISHPQVLQHGHSGFLVDRLKELLEDGSENQRVCRVVISLLAECGKEVADDRTAWAAAAGDLIDIALTLQRFPETRSCGLDTFEQFMDLDAYKVTEILADLDRPLPA